MHGMTSSHNNMRSQTDVNVHTLAERNIKVQEKREKCKEKRGRYDNIIADPMDFLGVPDKTSHPKCQSELASNNASEGASPFLVDGCG